MCIKTPLEVTFVVWCHWTLKSVVFTRRVCWVGGVDKDVVRWKHHQALISCSSWRTSSVRVFFLGLHWLMIHAYVSYLSLDVIWLLQVSIVRYLLPEGIIGIRTSYEFEEGKSHDHSPNLWPRSSSVLLCSLLASTQDKASSLHVAQLRHEDNFIFTIFPS